MAAFAADSASNGWSVRASEQSAALYSCGDAVADLLVDVVPVFERPLQHRFGYAVLEDPDDIGHQTIALGVVHDLAHQGAGLAEVVIILTLCVGSADKLAAGTPDGLFGIALGIGLRTALGVWRIDRIGDVFNPHPTALAVAVHRHYRPIDRDLLVVDAQAGPVSVGVGKQTGQQHLVRARTYPGHEAVRLEGRLLDFGLKVARIAVQSQPADLMQGIVTVGPDLGQIKGIEAVVLGLFKWHDLNFQRPAGVFPPLDRLAQIAAVVVGVFPGDPIGLFLGEKLDALVGLEVVLDPEPFAFGVNPHVRVARVAVHVPIALGDPSITHQDRDLMGGLWRQGPEVPLHVVVSQAAVRPALLRMDEVLELHWVANEKHRGVVSHHVVVALGGVELERKAAYVPPGVGTAGFAGHRREAGQHIGLGARLEQDRLGVSADVLGHLEVSEGPRAFRMRLAVRNHLPVEVGHLLHEVMVLKQDGAVRSYGEREFVTRDRIPSIVGGEFRVVFIHGRTSLF
jgi:hypothetical protein